MSWEENPYYHPERHGLTLVADVELSEPCYTFDTLAIWADDRGFYLGTDSGCSCPSPFEDYTGREDMTGPLTREQALEEASSLKTNTEMLDEWNAFVMKLSAYQVGAES